MFKRHLQYALKDNKIVHVSEVAKGLECGCICPACKSKLIAKKGNKVIHHFAHYNADECEHGYETALHLAAKEILFNAKKMVIPPLFLKFPYSRRSEIKIVDAQTIIIDKVELEKIHNDIIPDIVVYSCNSKFFVEIYVTNRVDEIKLEKIKKAKVSVLEIDLSKIDRDISHEELKKYLLKLCKEKYWLYNVNIEKWEQKFRHFVDRKPIVKIGFGEYVNNCPFSSKYYMGNAYANLSKECLYCDYFIGIEGGYVLCNGTVKISTKEDYKKYIRKNIKKENN